MPAPAQSMEWFSQARFGVFVHWGLYSIHGKDVWSMYCEETPPEEYRPLADAFTPRRFEPDDWAQLAKDAGARYMVMCARQHDGYSMWDSKVSDFTSVNEAAGRDFIADYVEATRRAGLGVGLYYSLLDWRYPAYFSGPEKDPRGWEELVEYVHAQLAELCSNYGEIDLLWYDGAWPHSAEQWRSRELNAAVRALQPQIVINDRSDLPEDYDTPEQALPALVPGRPWEACMTMNDKWGYVPTDTQWKTTSRLIALLVQCASGNGNLLLNIGPDPDGVVPAESVVRLREMGQWLRANGDAIYGTQDIAPLRQELQPAGQVMGPAYGTHVGMSHTFPTVQGNTLFIHAHKWPGRELAIGNLASRVVSARFLDGGAPIAFTQEGSRVKLSGLPACAPDPYDTVIALECDEVPRSVDRFG